MQRGGTLPQSAVKQPKSLQPHIRDSVRPLKHIVQTIGFLERGEYSPSLYLALKIAEYFEVPMEIVFSTEPFPRLS